LGSWLLDALGLRAIFVGQTRFNLLIEVESEADVRSAASSQRPDE
jgi:hypothetical protein